jgi:UDP-N-acetylenolpyruvoylglucosamine reductase
VGGGVLKNFGAFGQTLGDYVLKVDVFDQKIGRQLLDTGRPAIYLPWSSLHRQKQNILRVYFEKPKEHRLHWLRERRSKLPMINPILVRYLKIQ